MGVIYKITNPSGRIYIGQTKRTKIRIWEYRWRSKKRKSIVHDSIKAYGWDAHSFEIIEEIDNDKLNEREIFWIKELNSFYLDNPMGMNMTRGGEGGGQPWMHDIERRKKQSERFSGTGGTFYGKKHTEETKKIISEKARKRNIETGRLVPQWGAEKGRDIVRKKVACYDANGNLLSTHISVTEAGNFYSVKHTQVSASCLGKISGVDGKYVFKHFTDEPLPKIEVGEISVQNGKRPVSALNSDYEVIGEFPSAQEASDFFGIPKTTINRAAMYNWLVPIRSGHVFIYTDLYESILAAEAA